MAKVLQVPNVTTVERDALTTSDGALVYNTDDSEMQYTPDDGSTWITLENTLTDSIAGGLAYSATGSSGLTGTPTIVSSFEQRVGNVVNGTLVFTYTASANDAVIAITKSYGANFSSTTQACGSGNTYRTSGGDPSDGIMFHVDSINGAPRFSITVDIATTGVVYLCQVSFSYLAT